MVETIRLIPKAEYVAAGITSFDTNLSRVKYVEAKLRSWELAKEHQSRNGREYVSIVCVEWKYEVEGKIQQKEKCVDLLAFEEEVRDNPLDIFF